MHEEEPDARGSAPLASEPTPVHLRVSAVADQVANVRHVVLESAKAHGIGPASRDDIALAVSEACTNAVMHAYRDAAAPGPLAVDAYRDNDEFFVVVCDEGTGLRPRTDSPGLGLGLGLISRLAKRLEISSHDPVGAKITMIFAAPPNAPPRGRTATRSDRGEVEKPTGMDARENDQKVPLPQQPRELPLRGPSAPQSANGSASKARCHGPSKLPSAGAAAASPASQNRPERRARHAHKPARAGVVEVLPGDFGG